ncbi:HNH endonuclease [Haloarchaeobius sp. TZWWS8]|uniref:HNH endonuclease n=1 Tax=Haloarchaeobius sp. TZWWS8 TaxID=3446121 RepID=UPI003EBECAA3
MSEWRAVVRRELKRYQEHTGSPVLTRQEFLGSALPVFEAAFPNNRNPGQKFSQIMQQLRDRGEVTFRDYAGTYRILDLEDDEVAAPGPESPTYEASMYHQPSYRATEYETEATVRSMPAAFRTETLANYRSRGLVSGVDHPRLLDVAHILPWSEYESERLAPENVLLLSKTHHAAFDAELFTIDADYRLRVAPDFDTGSDLLRRTLLDRDGQHLSLPDSAPDVRPLLEQHNRSLDWSLPA